MKGLRLWKCLFLYNGETLRWDQFWNCSVQKLRHARYVFRFDIFPGSDARSQNILVHHSNRCVLVPLLDLREPVRCSVEEDKQKKEEKNVVENKAEEVTSYRGRT